MVELVAYATGGQIADRFFKQISVSVVSANRYRLRTQNFAILGKVDAEASLFSDLLSFGGNDLGIDKFKFHPVYVHDGHPAQNADLRRGKSRPVRFMKRIEKNQHSQ